MSRDAGSPEAARRGSTSPTPRWFYRPVAGRPEAGVAGPGQKDAAKSGPVDTDTLRGLLADGTLAAETEVWRDGLSAWMAAAAIEELAEAVAAGRARSSAGGAARRRRTITSALGAVALLAMVLSAVVSLLGKPVTAAVAGVVTSNGRPVSGGNVVLAPLAESKGDVPGKPAVANVADDGSYSMRLTPGLRGLAKRFRVRYSPPVLPPMKEEEAMKAVPPYAGLVPKDSEVAIAAGGNRIDIELVPAVAR